MCESYFQIIQNGGLKISTNYSDYPDNYICIVEKTALKVAIKNDQRIFIMSEIRR